MIQPRNPDEYVTQENIDAKTADLASALSFDGLPRNMRLT